VLCVQLNSLTSIEPSKFRWNEINIRYREREKTGGRERTILDVKKKRAIVERTELDLIYGKSALRKY
jgi:hypothetical protein